MFTEKNPFLTIENGIDKVTCPECNTPLPDANAVYEMTGQWWDENREIFPCPACGRPVSLADWRMEPEWGFSDLGFEFWNCPMFTEDFVAEMKRRLNSDVWIVYKHM